LRTAKFRPLRREVCCLAKREETSQCTSRECDGIPGLLVAGNGAFAPSLAAALLLGAGTAMVYPTLIAAVSDASQPRDRARVVGVYRFWRDFGFVVGALIAGVGADATTPRTAILIVAALTGASGLLVAATSWQPRGALRPAAAP
jgi:MFS family permease